MVMPPRSSSSGMQSIRRELQRRRPKPLAPKSSVAKKPSTSPPRPPRQEDPSSTASKSPPASAGAHATRPPLPRAQLSPLSAVISPSTPSLPSRSAPSSAGSDCRASTSAAAHLMRPGTAVGVRTRTTKLKTGKVLVLWLRAMVVSPTQEGYEVVYDGSWPPGDPYGTVHVLRRHVRMIKPSLLPTTPPPSLPPSCGPSSSASDTIATTATARKKEMRPAPRPTTAGKSLRLIRSLWPELQRQAQAAFPGY